MKLDWRKPNLHQPAVAPNCPMYTGQCPVPRLACSTNSLLSRKLGSHGYNSPDCPMCTGLSGVAVALTPRSTAQSVGDVWTSPIVTKLHWTFPVCQGGHGCNGWLRQKRKEITQCSLSGGAPDCPVCPRTEGNYCLPNGAPMAPSSLGAIKGTPRCMERHIKHLLNILRRLDSASTHLIHCV
jgi:hypothetical protein